MVDFPYPVKVRSSYVFTANMVSILNALKRDFWVVSDNLPSSTGPAEARIARIGIAPHFLGDMKPTWLSILVWGLKSALIQTKICMSILALRRKVDAVLFFMMYPYTEAAPMVLSKLLHKTVVKIPLGLAPRDAVYAPLVWHIFERVSLHFSDFYVPEYESTVEMLSKSDQIRNPQKMLPAAHFFFLEGEFRKDMEIRSRDHVVGYFGGLRKIKGVENLAYAILRVLEVNDSIKFIIAGEGVFKDQLKRILRSCPADRVTLTDWIPHHELAKSLNSVRLVVIPSFSESGPFVGIEALACGTPVLSTKVGIIQNLIQDGKSGFLLSSNAPEEIADRIVRIFELSDAELQRVADNGHQVVVDEFDFTATLEKWAKVLREIDAYKT